MQLHLIVDHKEALRRGYHLSGPEHTSIDLAPGDISPEATAFLLDNLTYGGWRRGIAPQSYSHPDLVDALKVSLHECKLLNLRTAAEYARNDIWNSTTAGAAACSIPFIAGIISTGSEGHTCLAWAIAVITVLAWIGCLLYVRRRLWLQDSAAEKELRKYMAQPYISIPRDSSAALLDL